MGPRLGQSSPTHIKGSRTIWGNPHKHGWDARRRGTGANGGKIQHPKGETAGGEWPQHLMRLTKKGGGKQRGAREHPPPKNDPGGNTCGRPREDRILCKKRTHGDDPNHQREYD